MICALSPAADNFEETLGTLVKWKFIYRDMLIRQKKLN